MHIGRSARRAWLAGLLLACLYAPTLSAQKTDVVVLLNGDYLTGEIKELHLGKLKYSTDDLGTVYIEWQKIAHVTSDKLYEIELASGAKFYGAIEPDSLERRIRVVRPVGVQPLDMISVVHIIPLEQEFWERLSGYLDLGITFTRANRQLQLTTGAEARYRYRQLYAQLTGDSFVNIQRDADNITRNSLGLVVQPSLENRWVVQGNVLLQENEELGLRLRASAGVGGGRYFVQSNRTRLVAVAGLTYNRENYFEQEEGQSNLEGLLASQFQFFRFHDPEVDLTSTLVVYPSITSFGRVRVAFDARIRYELFSDFFLTLTFYEDFDSDPGAEGATKNDYGFTTTFSWSF